MTMPIQRSNIPLLVGVMMASLTTGATAYAFGLYGNALKTTLHLTQAQLDTISSATFCAGLFSWVPGLFVDKFGPRCSLSTGGTLGAIALMLFWVVARQYVTVASRNLVVMILSVLGIIVFLCSAAVTGGVFKVIVSTCGTGNKGSAVGAAKGYVGLGSGVYAVLFESIRKPSETDLDFLPMSALFFIVAAAIPAISMLPGKADLDSTTRTDMSTQHHYNVLYLGLVTLAVLIAGESITELFRLHTATDKETLDKEFQAERRPDYLILFGVLLAWFGPILGLLCLPTAIDSAQATTNEEPTSNEKDEEEVPLQEPNSKELEREEDGENEYEEAGDDLLVSMPDESAEQGSEDDSNRNLYQMLTTSAAWLMLWSCTILVGGGTLMTNNMGQMVEALSFPDTVTSSALALFSVAQSGARVMTGAISEWALQWRIGCCGLQNGVPRPVFLIVASAAGVIAHLLLAVATTQVPFILGVVLSGAAFGMCWPLMVLIVGELFGAKNVGANYMFYDGFTSAIGTLLLSKFVAQEVYDDHIEGEPDNVTCIGTECFRATNYIVASLSATCLVTSVCMVFTPTVRKVYS